MTRRRDDLDRRTTHDAHGGPGTPDALTEPADELTREIVRAIAAPPPVPDLTTPIMGRLGFMRAAPAVVRRRRRRRVVLRGATCLLAGALVGAALYVHEIGPNARRPVGPSIPAAIGREVEHGQRGFQRAIQQIRDLAPVPVGPADPAADEHVEWPEQWRLDEDIDRSAVGPVRWL